MAESLYLYDDNTIRAYEAEYLDPCLPWIGKEKKNTCFQCKRNIADVKYFPCHHCLLCLQCDRHAIQTKQYERCYHPTHKNPRIIKLRKFMRDTSKIENSKVLKNQHETKRKIVLSENTDSENDTRTARWEESDRQETVNIELKILEDRKKCPMVCDIM